METLQEHWNEIFKKTDENKLGWHENYFSEPLQLQLNDIDICVVNLHLI